MNKVFSLSQLPAGHMHQVTVGDYEVLLANVAGEVYAVENKCSHYGFALTKGSLCEHKVRCPLHHACFDVRTGAQIEAPGLDGLARFAVTLEGDDILVGDRPEYWNSPKDQEEAIPAAPPSTRHFSYAIVGGGAAAAYAVEEIRAIDREGSIVLLSEETLPPYDRTVVSKAYLQGGKDKETLPLRSLDHYLRNGVVFRAGTRVEQVDVGQKVITLAGGESLSYERVLLATGGEARTLDLPGSDLAGIHTIRRAEDAEQASQETKEESRVVILGASFIGLEAALSLGKKGGKITVVAPEEVPFDKVFGAKVGNYVQQLHEAAGVTFVLGRKAQSFEGGDRVSKVILDNGEELPAEIVIVGIGVKPATDYLVGLATQDDGSLAVDGHLAAHAEGVWVAGDIATYPDREGMLRIEHWKVAAQQGRIAGRNMAGKAEVYQQIPFFWSNQQGINFRYVGHATDYNRIIFDGEPGKEPFLAFYLKDEHVQAVLGVKRDAETAAIHDLMALGKLPPIDRLVGADWHELCRKA